MLVSLLLAFFLGMLSVDLVHDFPGDYSPSKLALGKVYYCNLYQGLSQISGFFRVHLPVCVAGVLLLKKIVVPSPGIPAESRRMYVWVTAILSFPGLFLFGFCVFLVASACSAESGSNQDWGETLFRLGICHILMFSIFVWSIYSLLRGEQLARLAQQRKISKEIR